MPQPRPSPSEAHVDIRVWLDRDWKRSGSLTIAPAYYYTDGTVYEDPLLHTSLYHGTDHVIRRFWDALFEEVLRIQEETPRSIRLSLHPAGMGPWRDRVATVMRIVSHELRVPMAGARR